MEKRWDLKKSDDCLVQTLATRLNCHPVMATVLANRGMVSETDARMFLNASPSDLRSPFLLKDMDLAVGRIHSAIEKNEKILVFGDYDADGVTATAVLFEFLQRSGAAVSWYIPHRILEGYGLKPRHITDHAVPNHVDLLITVDCGSASFEAVASAKSAGIDVIVTDHHIPPNRLPEAVAVVNPNRPDCRGGLGALAGVGVAFYLLIALRRYLRDKHFWQTRPEPNLKDMCDLVSIGTIADMVPLLQENRILTRMGLTVIDKGQRPGIKALMGTSGAARREINAEDIAFKLAPRLNAAGRMAHAETAFTLLSLRGTKKATAVAQALTELNTRRQQVEKAMFNGIMKTLEENPPLLRPHGLVLADPDWHEGVLGIVASRLAKRYFRPVVLISLKHGMGKGSGRSVPGVDLVRVLSMCADDLDTFGGHAMAAGLSVSPDNVPQFQKHFDKAVAATSGSDPFTPLIAIDCRLDFKTITDGIIDQLDILQPFGTGNPEPLFMTQNVIVTDSKIVGGNHRRMRLTQTSDKTGVSFNAIQFNVDTTKPLPLKFNRIAYRLRWNRWNGTKSPQLMVEETEIHPA